MDIYIESLMMPNSFLEFKFGSKLNLSLFKIEEDYNPIGNSGSAYYFFNREIEVEVTLKKNLIETIDILLQNQVNELFLGVKGGQHLRLKNCSFFDLLAYLENNKLEWRFERILSEKSISIGYYSKLRMLFFFDWKEEYYLSLIQINEV